MRPALARRRLLVGNQKFALGQNGRVTIPMAWRRRALWFWSARLLICFLLTCTGSRTLLRLVVTSRRAVLVWRPASSDAGLRSSYHAGAGGAQEAKAHKARSQSTSMMKPSLFAITACCIASNNLATSHRATVGRKIFWVPLIFSFDEFLWGEQTCSHGPSFQNL